MPSASNYMIMIMFFGCSISSWISTFSLSVILRSHLPLGPLTSHNLLRFTRLPLSHPQGSLHIPICWLYRDRCPPHSFRCVTGIRESFSFTSKLKGALFLRNKVFLKDSGWRMKGKCFFSFKG